MNAMLQASGNHEAFSLVQSSVNESIIPIDAS
jgi:hypothetical protein